jgi:hypothetical protein
MKIANGLRLPRHAAVVSGRRHLANGCDIKLLAFAYQSGTPD